MGKLGNVVSLECMLNFLTQVEYDDEDEGQGNITSPVIGKGSKQDHHEYHTGGPQKRMREETGIKHAGNESRYDDHEKHGNRTIRFLEHWPEKQYVRKVGHEVTPVCMTCDMSKQTEIGKRIDQVERGRIGSREECPGKSGQDPMVKQDYEGAEEREGQGCRCVIFNLHSKSLWGNDPNRIRP